MALDPVEVTRLLEAASRTQWPTQKSVREAVDARLALRELAPEFAADWLRLRALIDRWLDVATLHTHTDRDGVRTSLVMDATLTQEDIRTLAAIRLGPEALAAAGVSEGNPE